MTTKSQKQSRYLKGDTFLMCLFLIVCLISGKCAGANQPEKDLSGVPENDFAVEAASREPNAVTNEHVVSGNDTSAAENAQPVSSIPEDAPVIVKSPSTSFQRELWKARISTSDEPDVNQARNELEQMIRQINAIEIKPRIQDPEPLITVETAAETEPNEMVPDTESSPVPESHKSENKKADGSVSEQTLQQFKELLQNPDQLANPLELAEILFDDGCLEEARVCYQAALNRRHDGAADPFEDRAWILLQLGNCLKDKDPQAAMETYKALVAEFPHSPWAQLAKAKSDVISWYLKDQPETVLNESKL